MKLICHTYALIAAKNDFLFQENFSHISLLVCFTRLDRGKLQQYIHWANWLEQTKLAALHTTSSLSPKRQTTSKYVHYGQIYIHFRVECQGRKMKKKRNIQDWKFHESNSFILNTVDIHENFRLFSSMWNSQLKMWARKNLIVLK